jgi:hypothetical protein
MKTMKSIWGPWRRTAVGNRRVWQKSSNRENEMSQSVSLRWAFTFAPGNLCLRTKEVKERSRHKTETAARVVWDKSRRQQQLPEGANDNFLRRQDRALRKIQCLLSRSRWEFLTFLCPVKHLLLYPRTPKIMHTTQHR